MCLNKVFNKVLIFFILMTAIISICTGFPTSTARYFLNGSTTDNIRYTESSSWSFSIDTTETTQSATHKKSCTQVEERTAGCMNEGNCFVVEVSVDQRMGACSCVTGWVGKRCELKAIPSDWMSEASTGIIIAIIIIFIVVIVSLFIWHRRCNKAQNADNRQTQRSLIGTHTGTCNSQAETPIG